MHRVYIQRVYISILYIQRHEYIVYTTIYTHTLYPRVYIVLYIYTDTYSHKKRLAVNTTSLMSIYSTIYTLNVIQNSFYDDVSYDTPEKECTRCCEFR